MSASVRIFLLLTFGLAGVFADVHFGAAEYDDYNAGLFGDRPNQTYHSTDIKSPLFLVNTWKKDAVAPGSHIFMSPSVGGQHRSPMIFSAKDLSLVYADPSWDGGATANLQEYKGKKYITFWSGKDYIGWGSGGGIMLDENYRFFANVTTTDEFETGADSHEFQLTPDGTALVNNYYKIPYNMTPVNGPADSVLHDSAFQEIDIETGEALFTWKAKDHFELHESLNGYIFDADGGGWDWFHQNSIQKTPDGNYLISARHLCMLALINGTDGSRIWQLGGKKNDFKDLSDGRATKFGFQHNSRFVDDTLREITFFDNNAEFSHSPTPKCDDACSRAVRVRLDYDAMTAELVQEFYHPKSVQAWAQGGVQPLPNGGAMIAWGTVPSVTEVNAEGETVMELQFSPWAAASGGREGVSFYRVYKLDYTAYPPWGPSIACVNGTLYVSWNGATEVASWSVFGGQSSAAALEAKNHVVPRAGFETAIEVDPSLELAFAQVHALDANGNALGSTDVVNMHTGEVLTVKVQLNKV
ncbi:hypothetical protein DL769_008001 [Monosporascus sp. CRB-8-3]|nr:hypothetical protein DL769_008001 [Monosporascus sp. CRB-8-3]